MAARRRCPGRDRGRDGRLAPRIDLEEGRGEGADHLARRDGRGAAAARESPRARDERSGGREREEHAPSAGVRGEPRRHLDASVRPGSEGIAITATDASADRARQVAQEAAVVFGQLVEARFGTSTPELHAAGLDSAHVLAGPDRHFLRNRLIGALVGLLLGSALMFVLASGTRQVAASVADDLSKREDLVELRVNGVTARERAIADRAGKLAALRTRARRARCGPRCRQARGRFTGPRGGLERAEARRPTKEIATRKRELEALAFAPPPPSPEPVPAPVVRSRAGPPCSGRHLESQRATKGLGDAHTGAPTAEQAENWRTTLYFLRSHASPDETLPPRSLDPLIADVFAEIVDRYAPS